MKLHQKGERETVAFSGKVKVTISAIDNHGQLMSSNPKRGGEDTTVKVYIKIKSGGTYRLIESTTYLAAIKDEAENKGG